MREKSTTGCCCVPYEAVSLAAMEYRSGRVRCVVLLCVFFTLCGVIYLGYFCPEKVCALTSIHNQHQYNRNQVQLPQAHTSWMRASSAARTVDDVDNDDADSWSGKNFWEVLTADDEASSETSTSSVVPWKVPYFPTGPDGTRVLRFPVKVVGVSYDNVTLNPSTFAFDIRGRDVAVFLHIQKTGGTTFGRHLVHDLDLEKQCECKRKGKMKRKRCKCIKPNSNTDYWLFSRFSTGWQCGLHADWTELTSCVDTVLNKEEGGRKKRRYYYITLLRDPVGRFLSEYLHVRRGATWKAARHWCGGHEATEEELPPCYQGENWEGVSLEDFLMCPSNLAVNRQTRMLADLTLVGCYNATAMPPLEREVLLLASAKQNLERLAYFGLCEYQQVAQYMFEEIFQMNFLTSFQQFNETHVSSRFKEITPKQLERVRQLNHLDVELYEFAKKLMHQRLERLKNADVDFQSHYHGLARPPSKTYQVEDIDNI